MLLMPGVGHARGALTDDPDNMFDQAAQDIGFRYETEFSGVDDNTLRKLLRSASRLVALEGQPPPTLAALERRVRGDLDRMQKVLRSEGYYAARVEYRMEPDRKPVRITLVIVTGARYVLKQFVTIYSEPGSKDPDLPRDVDRIGATPGQPARAEMVADARRRLLEMLANAGHPLATVVDQSAVVDHADDSLSVTIEITPGEQARFGPLEVAGATSVETDYIEGFIPWREGEVFDRSKLNDARQRLLDTGLFAAVAFERPNALDANGELPVTVRVQEGKHRSISLGGRWSTDEGFAVDAQWEHRNLFGRQESLSVSGELGEIKREFAAEFKKPHFLRRDQDLLASGALARENTDAFDGPLTRYFVGLQRNITENWKIVAGVPVEFSNLSDLQGARKFSLVGLEVRGERDTSNDRLDPSTGSRLRLSLKPSYGTGDNRVNFLTSQLGLSGYYAVDDEELYILAGRARFGSIVGESTATLPANKRFYAGGGASIRGYRLQSVGPLGAADRPLGGRSLFEVSAELRTKVTNTIGGVIFIDGGNAYDDELPNLSTDLQWAIGFGGRYFTTFGPVRLDFGFPLNPRDGVDDFMQFYISIGQAF
ncbi:MAG: autotransporter assembly complex family protein [Gammaproteobacteria bacterium]|nr:MAG: autotransporter assembly complex family protein [Gammaproteobacteria bacterium]